MEEVTKINIKCKKCQFIYKLDAKSCAKYIKKTGTKVQCPNCKHIFKIYRLEKIDKTKTVLPAETPEQEKKESFFKLFQEFISKPEFIKDCAVIGVMLIIFLMIAFFLERDNFFLFFEIIIKRSIAAMIVSLVGALCILFISTIISSISIYLRIPFFLAAIFISIWPVVFLIELFQESMSGHLLEIISLVFSGFLIYYFADQFYLDLKAEMESSYVESYNFKNHNIISTLREKIILLNCRQFPICCIQVATYTLFTDLMIFKEEHGKGIMSWVYTTEQQGQYPDKIYFIYLMVIILFLCFFKLYNITVLRFAETQLTGKL
ncbi:membrane hypothetical protein [Candidatus Magnetomoraceae bacterium gMMP-13]